MTTTHATIGGRYQLYTEWSSDAGSAVLVDGDDLLLQRPVTMLLLPASPSLAERLQQRRSAGRFSATGSGLAVVLDAGDAGGRTYLVLPREPGELLSDRIRRGFLSPAEGARVALGVLTAREQLRDADRPGGYVIDTATVIVGGSPAVQLVPVPRHGAPAFDDFIPVHELYSTITDGDDSVSGAHTGTELRIALDRIARPHSRGVLGYGLAEPDAHTTDVTGPIWSPCFDDAAGHPRAVVSDRSIAPRRRVTTFALSGVLAVALVAAGGYAIRQTATASTLSGVGQPTPTAVIMPPAIPPPVTTSGLLDALKTDPLKAGADGATLRDDLKVVQGASGEARRQNALTVLALIKNGDIATEYMRAAVAAVTPFTVLGTPADLIEDLGPNPAAGGANGHLLLNCMLSFMGKSQPQQQSEAREIVTQIPRWAAHGKIRPDLVDAAVRIVTPVADGTKTFTDGEAGRDLSQEYSQTPDPAGPPT